MTLAYININRIRDIRYNPQQLAGYYRGFYWQVLGFNFKNEVYSDLYCLQTGASRSTFYIERDNRSFKKIIEEFIDIDVLGD